MIISGIFSIISDPKDFAKSSIFKRKKKWSNKHSVAERTWTKDHSLKNLRSIHLGYLRVDKCRWKKNRWNPFGDRHGLPVPALHLQVSVRYAQRWNFCFALSSRETFGATESKNDPWGEFFRILLSSSMVLRWPCTSMPCDRNQCFVRLKWLNSTLTDTMSTCGKPLFFCQYIFYKDGQIANRS